MNQWPCIARESTSSCRDGKCWGLGLGLGSGSRAKVVVGIAVRVVVGLVAERSLGWQ